MSKTQIVSGGITDGTIATADIADDAVTAAKVTGLGKIAQIQSNTGTNNTRTNSTSYVDVMSKSITPSSTSSQILILHTGPSTIELDNTTNMGHIAIFRDSTNITTGGHNSSFHAYQGSNPFAGASICIVDSPSSTSEISYKVRAKVDNTSMYMNYNTSSQSRTVSLILMEILA